MVKFPSAVGKTSAALQAELLSFFGNPGSKTFGANLVQVKPPFKMYYDGKPINYISFHRLGALNLTRALQKIWDYYGHDQKLIDKYEISKFSGSYNPRMIRGSTTMWSNHAYGSAIDIDSEDNGFGTGRGDLPLAVIAAFKSEGFSWGGDYKGRTDPMHFELVDRGNPAWSFEQYLDHYKQNHGQLNKFHNIVVPPPVEAPKPVPKSMATSKEGLTQAAIATVTTVGATAQVAKPFLETTKETVASVSEIATNAGPVVETTKLVTTSVPDGFWINVVHFFTSPIFLSVAITAVIVGAGMSWYWRRQKAQEGV